ncbi:hypothetical protein ABW11_21010 [Pluralibacter gergoviae]|uniref:phage baseplate plug family protein n=1 Tax=Pluralibacter gergoviae TaxID=61647 RepID=UPI0006520544|nr:hypothetical protein [Pluralibacter gergoviae]KMK23093.1 hypothetical protein ABW11_21010 [Pluralibacter gergoviae]
MQEISLQPSKSQEVRVSLGNQSCRIRLHQRSTGLYIDLWKNDAPVMQGVICLNCTRLVRYPYLGFRGDLVFVDTLGADDPAWDGTGERFKLYYLTDEERQ